VTPDGFPLAPTPKGRLSRLEQDLSKLGPAAGAAASGSQTAAAENGELSSSRQRGGSRRPHPAPYSLPPANPDTQLLLAKLKLALPPQAPPKSTAQTPNKRPKTAVGKVNVGRLRPKMATSPASTPFTLGRIAEVGLTLGLGARTRGIYAENQAITKAPFVSAPYASYDCPPCFRHSRDRNHPPKERDVRLIL